MKLSKYTIIKEFENKLVLYNLITGAILCVDSEIKNLVNELYRTKNISVIDNPDVKKTLIEGGFIIEEYDELKFMNYISRKARDNRNTLSLTLIPTLECNFKCPYCYEINSKKNRMSNDIEEAIPTFINKILEKNKINRIKIMWYGGEPLLALEKIEFLKQQIDNIADNKKIDVEYSMVSNGFLINDKNLSRIENLELKDIQITIDGPKDTHNQRRILKDGSPTYNKILKSINYLTRFTKVIIRINIDNTNYKNVKEILMDLNKVSNKENLFVYVARVDPINSQEIDSVCLTNKEFSDVEIDFNQGLLEEGYNVNLVPPLGLSLCGAMTNLCYVIDPFGDIHKCWNTVGVREDRVGNIIETEEKNFKEIINDILWSSADQLDEECKNCKVLPLCYGGCSYYKIKGKKRCISFKENIDDLLSMKYKEYKNSLI